MRILAIETSCDETALAVVSTKGASFIVEKEILSSQIATHAKTGGVVPEVAARMHMETLIPLLMELGVPRDGERIDAIAVTAGPGLVVALRVGVETAKTLAHVWKKPLVAVNHLAGHLASAWIGDEKPTYPILSLLVSGGHTEIILSRALGNIEVLGSTRDDAAGEAFDKVAKLLGLGYPGGPEISMRAKAGRKDAFTLPRPMLDQDNFDFSFSGLKTAVRREVGKMKMENGKRERGSFQETDIDDMSASFQEAVVETLMTKMECAIDQVQPASMTLVGGVSANEALREAFASLAKRKGVACFIPERKYSTDNAVMIAVAGLMKLSRGETVDPLTLKADPHLELGSNAK